MGSFEGHSATAPDSSDTRPSVFISYARPDRTIVKQFADELNACGVDTWVDVEFLKPGQLWAEAISEKLTIADALVSVVSPTSLGSSWVYRELAEFSLLPDRTVIPVLVDGAEFSDLPRELAERQAVRIDHADQVRTAARQVAAQVHVVAHPPRSRHAERISETLANDLARDLRLPAAHGPEADRSIFLVHGHDHDLRDEVEGFLDTLGIKPVVLARVKGQGRSLLGRFETEAGRAKFAIVLLSSDDLGAARRQFEDPDYGGKATLRFRARQNVVLELGFFGRLGWENVFVVHKPAERVWPDFETPSDLGGAVFYQIDGEIDWREELSNRLREAGLVVDSEV